MRRILLDAQLIVLLVVGNVGRDKVGEHKRLAAYRAEDWDLLIEFLADYDRIVVTPNVLTEASNHLRLGGKGFQSELAVLLAAITCEAEERYIESRSAVAHSAFARLGLADAASLEASDPDVTLLTADAGLYLEALRGGGSAVNFNHLRDNA